MLESVLGGTRPREEPTGEGEETDDSDKRSRQEQTGDGEETYYGKNQTFAFCF